MSYKKGLKITIFSFVIIAFFCLNAVTPFLEDDFWYSYQYPGYALKEIRTFYDIAQSQYDHYIYHNGRSIAEGICQLFCSGLIGNKISYDIFATILFALFVLFLGKFCFPQNNILENAITSVGYIGMFFMYMEEPTCLYNGICFGCNYLYPVTLWLIFIYLLCYRRTNEKWRIFTVVSMAFVVGWSHEGVSIPFCAATFVWAIKNKKELTISDKVSLMLCYIGCIIMIFAPANINRASVGAVGTSPDMLKMMRAGINNYYLLILIAFWFFLYWKHPAKIRKFVNDNSPLIIGFFVSFLFQSYIGWITGRSIFGFQLFTFVIYARLIQSLNWVKLNKTIKYAGLILVLLGIPFVVYYQKQACDEYRSLYAHLNDDNNKTVTFQFDNKKMPDILRKYVCQHQYSKFHYWDDKYTLLWRKPVYVSDAPVVNFSFDNSLKVDGVNPFYTLGDLWITKDKLPPKITIEFTQGEYESWNLKSVVQRMHSKLGGISETAKLMYELNTDSMCIGKKNYLYYCRKIEYDLGACGNVSRKILKMDMIK